MGIALASLVGVLLIAGWSLTEGVAPERRAGLAMRSPGSSATPTAPVTRAVATGNSAAARKPATPTLATDKPQGKVNCAGCGVIEAVLRIDTPVAVMAGCYAGDGPGLHGRLMNVGGPYDPDSLTNTVASVIADGRGRKKVTVDTRHQIIVRFRDGSKQVFDEATPRSLHVGDRIVVVAGTEETKVLVGTRGESYDLWRSVRSRTDG